MRKIDTMLSAPGGSLDLSAHCASHQRDGACYDVVCVANHVGSCDSGHYTATCRIGDAYRGTWWFFDDHRVSQLAPYSEVVGRDAYVIFLQRHNDSGSMHYAGTSGSDPLRQSLTSPELWPHWDNMRHSI